MMMVMMKNPELMFVFPLSGEDFHPTSNSLIHGTHVPSREAVNRMQEDVEKQ